MARLVAGSGGALTAAAAAVRGAAGRASLRTLVDGVSLAILGALIVSYVAHAIGQIVTPDAGNLDFAVYHRAAGALADGHQLYATPPPCCFAGSAMDGYTYPPLLAIVLRPLAHFPVDDAARVFLVVTHACLIGAFVLMVRMLCGLVSTTAIVWFAIVFVTYGPLYAGVHGIQVDAVLLLLVTVAAMSIVDGRRGVTAGAALGVGGAIKLIPLLLAPALLLLRRRVAVRGAVALVSVLGATLVVMLLVTSETVTYFFRVLPSFSSGVVTAGNRSLPGVILRTVDATGHAPQAWLRAVFAATEVALLGVTLISWRGVNDARGRRCAIAAMLAAIPIVQGVTWDHHLVTQLLVVALLLPWLRAWRPAWFLAVPGVLLSGVNQLALDPWLASAGFAHPHGAGILVFAGEASIDLLGMVCLWIVAMRCLSDAKRASAK